METVLITGANRGIGLELTKRFLASGNHVEGTTIDVLINCAGIFSKDPPSADDIDYSSWRQSFEVNTIAPFRIVTTFKKNLQSSKNPRVITLSSQMGALSSKSTGHHAYRSSKAAVNKVMQVLSTEFESDGIVVCPVHPGWVRTDMGGENADLSVEECGAGLVKLINSLTMAHSGRFWTWDGKELSW